MRNAGSGYVCVSIMALALGALSLHADLVMGADVYRWMDEDGVAHFSDQPPPPSLSKSRSVTVSKVPEYYTKAMEDDRREYVIPFERAYGGILVNVLINDHLPAKLVLDTGSSSVKLNVGLIKKLNQRLPANPRKGKTMTAAGVVETREIFIEKIDLGGAVKKEVQASYMDEAYDFPYYDGLLGLSFLSDFKMTIDHQKNVIHLWR